MKKTGRQKGKRWVSALVVLVLIAGYGGWASRRTLPAIPPVTASGAGALSAAVPGGSLSWPADGQSAVGIVGSPILQTHGQQTGVPTASTAKLITVLSVLRQKPLAAGQQGPPITLSASDVAIYNSYVAQQGSVVKVVAGEQISEYQMIEAILLPSANNMADSLAIWAFGSLNAYAAYANNYVSQLGLTATHIGSDASGFQPNTVSSAHDLVSLGEIAMQNPVLAQIVGQPTASGLPIVGDIKNVNFLLGTANIVGIKTGNTDQAGGVFVAAARVTVNGKPVTVVTAVLGAPNLFAAMKDSLGLIQSAQTNFKPVTVVKKGTIVGSYELPWGGSVPAVTTGDLTISGWSGSTVTAKAQLRKIPANSRTGQIVGTVNLPESALTGEKPVAVQLQTAPSQPSAWWRLSHPLN